MHIVYTTNQSGAERRSSMWALSYTTTWPYSTACLSVVSDVTCASVPQQVVCQQWLLRFYLLGSIASVLKGSFTGYRRLGLSLRTWICHPAAFWHLFLMRRQPVILLAFSCKRLRFLLLSSSFSSHLWLSIFLLWWVWKWISVLILFEVCCASGIRKPMFSIKFGMFLATISWNTCFFSSKEYLV